MIFDSAASPTHTSYSSRPGAWLSHRAGRAIGRHVLRSTALAMLVGSVAAGSAGLSGVALGPVTLATSVSPATTFTASGIYTVPASTTEVTFDVYGGHGGGGSSNGSGGNGGENKATLSVLPGEFLQITVGAAGANTNGLGGGGGGASDVRSGSCAATAACVLTDRVIVAGGGGGGGACSIYSYPQCTAGSGGSGSGANGNGGAASGYNCNGGGGGGTGTAGGGGGFSNGNLYPGSPGTSGTGGQGGGYGGNSGNSFPGGSGGDGYFGGGGGGGGTYSSSCDAGGGGGGSGYSAPSVLASTVSTGVEGGAGTVIATPLTGTSTATTLGSSMNPQSVQQSVLYTATVSPIPDGGNVQFTDGTQTISGCATVPVSATGTATCSVTYNAMGTHPITAAYLGDANYLVSSAAVSQGITAAPSTSTSLGTSVNPATVRQSVTYTATVALAPDGGTVAFTDNGTTIPGCGGQGVNTSSGVATCVTSYAVAGANSVVATYGGDATYPSSTSGALTENISAAAATTTTLSSSINPSIAGGSVTYTAQVTPAPDAGSISFTDGGTTVTACASQPLSSSGYATCTVTYSTSGTHPMGAAWAGDTSYPASSAALTQTVNPRVDATTLATSKNPTAPGEQVTYSATVTPNPGGGTMAFADNGAVISTCAAQTVSTTTGIATCTVVYTTTGTHPIVATYSGDSLYPGGTSTTVTQSVTASNPTYTTPGTYLYTVPAGVTQITATTYGGQGGGGTNNGSGAAGGEAGGTMAVTAGQTYQITVGAAGANTNEMGGGGGGASEFLSGVCAANLTCTLTNAIVVAGGGGGGGACSSISAVYGQCSPGNGGAGSGANGNGGSASGSNCNGGGGGGTSTAGGGGGFSNGNLYPGSPGTSGTGGLGGGYGGNSGNSYPGGTGGDGYFGGGGGGGGTSNSSCDAGGGGGGSGYVASSLTSPTTATGGHGGNGEVVITEYTPTTVAVTTSAASTTYGQSLTLTATLSSTTATGSVQFTVNGVNVGGPVAVNSGVATLAISTISAGTPRIGAVYTPTSFNTPASGTLATVQTVNPATLTVVPNNQSATYGQASPIFSDTITGYQNGDTSTSLTSLPTCGVAVAHVNVGSYSIACSGGVASNYTFNESTTATYTVTPATLVVTPASHTITYGSSDPVFTFVITGYQYTDTSTSLSSLPTCSVPGTHSAVGTYTISCSGGAAANYDFNETATGTLTVVQAVLTVHPAGVTSIYGTTPTFPYSITGYVNGDTSGVITTPPTCSVVGSHRNVGSYEIDCSGGSASNYTFDDSATATLTVNPATLTVTPQAESITYGQSDPVFIYGLTGYQYSDTAASLSALPTCGVVGPHANAGTYTIKCSGGASANYIFNYAATATLTVSPEWLTVVPINQSKTYGAADPVFTYGITGYQSGDTAGSLTTLPACTVASTHSNVGSYVISCSGGAAANYLFNDTATATLTVGQATLVVTPDAQSVVYGNSAPPYTYVITGYQNGDTAAVMTTLPTCTVAGTPTAVGSYSIGCTGGTASNYVVDDSATAQLTITPATLTVTPDAQYITYGQSDPSFTYGITGFQYTDTAASLRASPICDVVAAHTNAGTYQISCSGGSAANYIFDDTATATLTVSPAWLTVVPNNQSKTYGAVDPAFTYGITGYQSGDTAGSLTTLPACTVAGTHSNVGSYVISCSGGTSVNYLFDDGATATLTVSPTMLTVVPNNRSKTYGAADPAFTYVITGYQNGDTASALTTLPTCSVAGTHKAVGSYSIGCTGGTALNYTFNDSATAKLDISQATLTVTPNAKTLAFGTPDVAYTYTVTGFVAGDTSAVLTSSPTCGVTVSHSAVGSYIISCRGGTSANYRLNDTATAPLTVTSAGGYVVDVFGRVHAEGSAPGVVATAYWPGNQIAQALITRPDGHSGYVLDNEGGVHPFGVVGDVPTVPVDTAHWSTSVARAFALNPCDSSSTSGYVLDDQGGVHPFGGAPSVITTAYWPGRDIARGLALSCSGGEVRGYVLDGEGGLHPVAQAQSAMPSVPVSAKWGFNIARAVVLTGGGTAGYVLDGWGGIHPFGGAPAVVTTAYWPGEDIARAFSLSATGTFGWVIDAQGKNHGFGTTGLVPASYQTPATWPWSAVVGGSSA